MLFSNVGQLLPVLLTYVVLIISFIHFTKQEEAIDKPCGCGFSVRQARIVGGKEAVPFMHPWTVGIILKNGRHYFLHCGGVIISTTYVLTAAHCAQNFDIFLGLIKFTMMVNIGDHDISTVIEADNEMIKVKTLIPHPYYNKTTFVNDIALLKLDKSIVFSTTIQPICVPPSIFNLEDQFLTVAGWGNLIKDGFKSDTLQEVTIPVIGRSICQAIFKEKTTIEKTEFCAGFLDGSGDACQGDSGGPAIYKCNEHYYVAGIVSFGLGCATKDYPGVYTHVSHYADWITNNTNDDKPCFPVC